MAPPFQRRKLKAGCMGSVVSEFIVAAKNVFCAVNILIKTKQNSMLNFILFMLAFMRLPSRAVPFDAGCLWQCLW